MKGGTYMYYVVVDIGCIECLQDSEVLGIFEREGDAKTVLDLAKAEHEKNKGGEHLFEVFKVEKITKEVL
jgi:hypothetical protein